MGKFTYTSNDGVWVDDQSTEQSTIDVYGLDSPVKNTSVGIDRFGHDFPADIDMLLVAPDRQHNLEFMSDTGGSNDFFGESFEFADWGLTQMVTIGSGTYLPTDNGAVPETASDWGLSIPVINHPSNATFESSFGGIDGNGDWSLFIHDDSKNDTGHILGWSVTVITDTSTATLAGDSGDDLIRILSDDNETGVFEINERGGVRYEQVNDFIVDGGGGNDVILTGDGVDQITAGSGRDIVHAGGGTDYMYVGDSDDEKGEVYDGGSGDDWLIYTGSSALDLRDDTLQSFRTLQFQHGGKLMMSAAEASMLMNIVAANDITHPDILAITMGTSTGVDLGQFNIAGFEQDGDKVTITGDNDAETILGSKVDDVIKAAGGDDYIRTYAGRDTVDGGKGSDRIDYSDRAVSVKVTLKAGHTTGVKIDGSVEDRIKNIENVSGGAAADKLIGDKNANSLIGYGNDDILKGGLGNDTLTGGLGGDTMAGGAGRDQFTFISTDFADEIKDFSHADDTIGLSAFVFTAFTKLGAIKQNAFHANDAGHEAHTAKQHLIYDKSDGSLWYDPDGNGQNVARQIAVFDHRPGNIDFHDFMIV